MTRRLTSSSLAGTSRKLVAVGTSRLASMLATMRAPAPADRARRPGSAAAAAAFGAAAGGRRGGRGRRRPGPAGRGGGRGGGGLRLGVAPVVGEEVLPALAHRRRVGEVLLVHLVDQPGVGPEGAGEVVVGGGVVSHGAERTGAGIHHSDGARGVDPIRTQPDGKGGGAWKRQQHSEDDDGRLVARPPPTGRAPRWPPTRSAGTSRARCCPAPRGRRGSWSDDVDHVVALPHLRAIRRR